MTTIVYLAIQSTYQTTDIALFENSNCLERRFYTDHKASSHLIPHIDTLLKEHNKSLCDLNFIAVDKGPGAFTTLRVTIATLNGIAFAQAIILLGIDGLEALSNETLCALTPTQRTPSHCLVTLLNAYNNDVYFLITKIDAKNTSTIDYGCKKIDELLQNLTKNSSVEKMIFTGNGAILHKERIKQTLGSQAIMPDPLPTVASSLAIGSLGLSYFKARKNIATKITPNYLKTQLFAVKKIA